METFVEHTKKVYHTVRKMKNGHGFEAACRKTKRKNLFCFVVWWLFVIFLMVSQWKFLFLSPRVNRNSRSWSSNTWRRTSRRISSSRTSGRWSSTPESASTGARRALSCSAWTPAEKHFSVGVGGSSGRPSVSSPVCYQKKKNRLMMRVYVWVCACIWACVCLPACFESASILYSFCWLFWLSTTSSYPSHRRFLHSDTVTVHPQTNSSHRNGWGFVYGQTCSENLLEAASAALTAHRLTSLSYRAAAMNNPHVVFSFFIKERSKQLGQKNTFKYKSYSNHDAANISWIINVVIISKITSKCNSEINLK